MVNERVQEKVPKIRKRRKPRELVEAKYDGMHCVS